MLRRIEPVPHSLLVDLRASVPSVFSAKQKEIDFMYRV